MPLTLPPPPLIKNKALHNLSAHTGAGPFPRGTALTIWRPCLLAVLWLCFSWQESKNPRRPKQPSFHQNSTGRNQLRPQTCVWRTKLLILNLNSSIRSVLPYFVSFTYWTLGCLQTYCQNGLMTEEYNEYNTHFLKILIFEKFCPPNKKTLYEKNNI